MASRHNPIDLLRRAGGAGTAAEVASRTGVDVADVYRVLGEAERAGLIAKHEAERQPGQRGVAAAIYSLLLTRPSGARIRSVIDVTAGGVTLSLSVDEARRLADDLHAVLRSLPIPDVDWPAVYGAVRRHVGELLTREAITEIVAGVWPDLTWERVRARLTQAGVIRDARDGTFEIRPPKQPPKPAT